MANYSKEDILAQVDQLTSNLNQLEEVERFKELEARLNANQKVKQKIADIKALQKQAVNLQAYGKTEAVKQIDQQIDAIQAEIDTIPIVAEFKSTQVVVNDILQLLIKNIEQNVQAQINSDQ
ncbi:RicAFT regulatory complex protein RicA family protein [Amphibacillus sediminis]|uniref:RicAFT regulatory complex protein RicA family protein n=1 Tax=Amphibacillus sediminis TaxID=360185 RepID=UPI0008311593|nr:YlbF family regulator [Amphibacillus sediminis]